MTVYVQKLFYGQNIYICVQVYMRCRCKHILLFTHTARDHCLLWQLMIFSDGQNCRCLKYSNNKDIADRCVGIFIKNIIIKLYSFCITFFMSYVLFYIAKKWQTALTIESVPGRNSEHEEKFDSSVHENIN